MALYEELAPQVTEYYWTHSFEELADKYDCGISTIQRAANHAELPRKTEWNRVEYEHGVSVERVLYHLHHDLEMATPEIAETLDITRGSLAEWFKKVDVKKRSRSEAERLKWEQMTPEERDYQVRAAHEASRKEYAQYRTSNRGYEVWREYDDGDRSLARVHRLCAVAWYGLDAVKDNHVHHENKIPWDNREDNLRPIDPSEHHRLHGDERRDPVTGQFT